MLNADQVAASGLTDWRKIGQGFHERFLTEGFSDGARFATAIAAAGDELGHHPVITMGDGYVDLKTISRDAIYRDEDTSHVVEWVTQRERFHLDVWVAPEAVEERIAAAVAAGGVIVDDANAPSFTVIADRDGNRACVCTS
jgi:pterin-4a-carbinolamine dehydratase